MIFTSLLFTKLGPPFETPSGGAWDDQITYNFTTDPEYTDVDYVNHYRDLYAPHSKISHSDSPHHTDGNIS